LVAAPDLGSGAERRMGSSPFIRTYFFPPPAGFLLYKKERGHQVI